VTWAIGVLAAALPFIIPLGFMDFFIRSWITITAVLGLTILTGHCGQISLGHTAFMAVGAFVGAVLLNKGIPLVLVLILTDYPAGSQV
jgi:branched-chain amino acid transport system permease protein